MALRSGGLWRRAYEVDFTSLSNQDLKSGGDGNKTIDGKTWLLGNSANCTSINVTNGTGIVFVASATNTGYYEGAAVRNAPNLTLPISTAVPLFNISQNAIRILLRMTLTNADANAEGGKLFVEDSTTPANQHAWIAKWFSGGAISYRVSDGVNGVFTIDYPDNTAASGDDIMSLIFWPSKSWEAYSGLYAAGDKMRLRTSRVAFHQDVATGLMRFSPQPRLGLCQVTNNATASLTTTFTHMRVDFHDRHPAI